MSSLLGIIRSITFVEELAHFVILQNTFWSGRYLPGSDENPLSSVSVVPSEVRW
jgi:hypothetical protein